MGNAGELQFLKFRHLQAQRPCGEAQRVGIGHELAERGALLPDGKAPAKLHQIDTLPVPIGDGRQASRATLSTLRLQENANLHSTFLTSGRAR